MTRKPQTTITRRPQLPADHNHPQTTITRRPQLPASVFPGEGTLETSLARAVKRGGDCERADKRFCEDQIKYMRCGKEPPRPLRSGVSLIKARYVIITNWSTFAQALELPGCEQRLHMPFFNVAEVPGEIAFVFKASKDETGVLMLSRKLRDTDLAASVLGGTVDPVIFPD